MIDENPMSLRGLCPYMASIVLAILLFTYLKKRERPESTCWDIAAFVTIATGIAIHIVRAPA